jgi:hypothetical protein
MQLTSDHRSESTPSPAVKPPRGLRVGLLAFVTILAAAGVLYAAKRDGVPASLLAGRSSLAHVERVQMPTVELAALREEDAELAAAGLQLRPRFAHPMRVALAPDRAGTWEELADGSQIWRLRIASPGALSINLGFSEFDIPSGAALWIYDPDGASVQGPYTAADRNAVGGLWTAVVLGEEIVVELFMPLGGREQARVLIGVVNHGYRFFGEGRAAANKQGSCNIDVICPEGDPWRRQIRSVARISISGTHACTGQLLNNTAQDDTPYFLTAEHCVGSESEAASVVAYWNYESPECGLLAGGSLSQNQSGATLRATGAWITSSDFALIELDETPHPSFNVYYAGWDATGTTPQGAVGIHHPRADEKAISFDYDPLTPVDYYGSGQHQWQVGAWEEGTTEGGSSGSCIFEPTTGLCVGTLTWGTASCEQPDGFDIYGRFDVHYTGGGTPDSRLMDWLDPIPTGVLMLAGKEPEGGPNQSLWLIPAAASTPGSVGSDWRSQIMVVNPTDAPIRAELYYVSQLEDWPGSRLLPDPITVDPGKALYLDDPLRNLNPTSGLIYASLNSPDAVVSSRTYNLSDEGVSFGQGIPGVLLDGESAPTSLIIPLVHSAPGRFRTNLGLVQTSRGFLLVQVSIFASDGALLAQRNWGSPGAFRQINDIFTAMGLGGEVVEGAWIRVRLVGPAPSYWSCYASVVDDGSNDPTYVFGVEE